MTAAELKAYLDMYVADDEELFIRTECGLFTILDLVDLDGKKMLLGLEVGK